MQKKKLPIVTALQYFSNGTETTCLGRAVSNYQRARFFEGQKRFNHFLNILKLYLSNNWSGVIDEELKIVARKGQFSLRYENKDRERFDNAFKGLDKQTIPLSQQETSTLKKVVVSDFDDTIIKSRATSLTRLIFTTLTKPIGKREVFSEVAPYYKILKNGREGNSKNHFFYLSSSTWDIYPLLRGFLAHSQLPDGILLLKEMTMPGESNANQTVSSFSHKHKIEKIEYLLDFYSDLPFVLIGDAGQEDAAIYLDIAKRFPGRIENIFIRRKWWEKILPLDGEIESDGLITYFNSLEELDLNKSFS